MSGWKERLTIGNFSFAGSLAIWGIVLLSLLMLSLALYASVAGTAPGDDFFFGDF